MAKDNKPARGFGKKPGESLPPSSSRPKENGNSSPRNELKASELSRQGRPLDIETIYRQQIQDNAANHETYFHLAAICSKTDRKKESIELLKRAIALKPDFPEALSSLGVALKNQGDLDAAIDCFNKALALKTNFPEALSNLGLALKNQGDLDAAIDCFNKALALKPDYPEALSNLGNALKNQGDLDAAIICFNKALALKPNFPEALSNLGIAITEQGDLDAAIACFNKALNLKSDYPEALSNLGVALTRQGQLDNAIATLNKALAHRPDYPEALSNLGLALKQHGDLDATIACFNKALGLRPNYPEALCNLGLVLTEKGELNDAIDAFNKALFLRPEYPEALSNLGLAFKLQDDLEGSISCFYKALAVKSNYPEALCNLGLALIEKGELDTAIDSLHKALALRPNYAEALSNLGLAHTAQDDIVAGITCYRKALAIKPTYADALSNLGVALIALGKLDDALANLDAAISCYDQADTNRDDYAVTQWNLSLALLLCGNYTKGWDRYEWRWKINKFRKSNAHPPIEQWTGHNHEPGEELLLVSEQGLGDTLQFMRYAAEIKRKGLNASICAPKKLHSLIHSSGLAANIYTPDESSQVVSGKWMPLLSLPRHLNIRPDNIIINEPYIKAPEERIQAWKSKIDAGSKPVIALNWQGNPTTEKSNLKGRSLPLEAFKPLTAHLGIQLLSLQKGFGSEQLETCSFRHRFIDCQQEINNSWDFLETAAIIMSCDLVITSDTAVAHLAGGLGKTTWLLLQKIPDWRWGLEGETTFWYPSMRLFRQRERETWAAVMERVALELGQFLNEKNSPTNGYQTKPMESSPSSQLNDNDFRIKQLRQEAINLTQQCNPQEAEEIYRKIIEDNDADHEIFFHLAVICSMTDRNEEAIEFLKQTLALNPNCPEALFRIGLAYKNQGGFDAAITYYNKALALRPNYPEALSNLGVALKNKGDLKSAIACYNKALALKPNYPEALSNLGVALKNQGDLDAAIASFKNALVLKPNYPEALSNLGLALKNQGDLEGAIACFKQALSLKPNFPEALSNLGLALKNQGNLNAAISCFNQALTHNPNYPKALTNLGVAITEQGDLDAAIANFKKALAIEPDYADAQWNLSLALLLSGNYAKGWDGYEWRWKIKEAHKPHAHPTIEQWTGQNHKPREELLLVSEQGIGDTLQFMRYAAELKRRGLITSFCAPQHLHGLIRSSDLASNIYTPDESNQIANGKWITLLSLPRHLNIRPDNVIINKPYIKAQEEQVQAWKAKINSSSKPVIALNWQGNPKIEQSGLHKGRSLPLESFEPLTAHQAIQLLSLQKGFGSEQLKTCSFSHRFIECQEEINHAWDFLETAAIIMNCDLVITSDTSVAHLAGGLGKTTWLLLQKVPDWRWGMEGESTFWYPSMRLFRQKERGNWEEVMERVALELGTFLCEHKRATDGLETKTINCHPPSSLSKDNESRLEQRKQEAITLINKGSLYEAEAIYRQLIADKTADHITYGNLAVICKMTGKGGEVIELLTKALTIEPNHLESLANLGNALKEQGKFNAAIDAYKKAVSIKPDFTEASFNLGNTLKQKGDLDAAIASYNNALTHKPSYPEALINLGNALKQKDDLDAAVASYNKSLAIRPNDPEALTNLGIALKEQGDIEAAIACFKKSLSLKPNDPEALYNLGLAHTAQDDIDAAISCYRRALAINPDHAGSLSDLGLALIVLGELDSALASLDAAVAYYDRADAVQEDYAVAQWNLSLALLLSGDYSQGWESYEWRWSINNYHNSNPHPLIEKWTGLNHEPEEELLLVSEQGLGDVLQFMRYANEIKCKGLSPSICAPRSLHGLIQASGLANKIYDPEEATRKSNGKWIPLLSLPKLLNVRPDNVLINKPYIKVSEEQIQAWKGRFAAGTQATIALNWQGNPKAEKTGLKGRSIALEAFAPITTHQSIQLVSLQKGFGSEQLETCSFRHRFVDCQEEISNTWDFLETAAIIMNCALVITSDTAVAHLAGGLGKTTWLLLQKVPDWRWGLEGETTFWYPSMRLFRQRERGNWREVIERVAQELGSFLHDDKSISPGT